MTICGCKGKSNQKGRTETEGFEGTKNSPLNLIDGGAIAEILVGAEAGDVLAQTIGVPKQAVERRQSTVRRLITARRQNSPASTTLDAPDLFADDSTQSNRPVLDLEQSIARASTAANPASSVELTNIDVDEIAAAAQTNAFDRADHEVYPREKSASIIMESGVETPHIQLPNAPDKHRVREISRDIDMVVDGPPSNASSAENEKTGIQLAGLVPDPSLNHLADTRTSFVKLWLQVLRMSIDDVEYWLDTEALLKAHVLGRLIRCDCERISAYLEEQDVDLSTLQPSQSCILPVDGGIPLLESMLPPEIVVELGGGMDILSSAKHHAPTAVLEELKTMASDLCSRCSGASFAGLQEKWSCFGEIVTVFDLNQRISFDVAPGALMSHKTLIFWDDVIAKFNAKPIMEPLRVLTAPANTANTERTRAGGFRRSLSRSVRRMGQKIKYRRNPATRSLDNDVWVAEEKPQLSLAYRLHSDGNVSVKVRCKLPVAFTNMVVVLDDIDGFKTWLPYCSDVDLIKQYGTASYLLSYIADMPWPIKKRETLAFCEGLDALDELGQLIVLVKNPPLLPDNDRVFGDPLPPPRPKIPRIPKCALIFFVRPISADVTGVELFARLDPGMNVKLLKGIIPWMVKNTVVDFMVKIANLAEKVNLEAILNNPEQDTSFYRLVKQRGERFIASQPAEEDEVLTEKQRRLLGFDDSDSRWYRKLPVLKL